MKKMFFALAAFMVIGVAASKAQTTNTTKQEVKVESTTPKTCSGHSDANKTSCSGNTTSTAPKTCCSSSTNTSCSGSTTMTSTNGGKTENVKTCDHSNDSGKKNSKNKKNMTSCNQSPNNKTCCSQSEGHK